MNTVTHLIAASALLARRDAPQRNLAVAAGALLPDLSMYIFFAWSRLEGLSMQETWEVAYWSEPWQTLGAVSNSIPLALLLIAIGIWRGWPLMMAGAGAMLIHAGLDLPLHGDDAHRHFWPLSDWRFVSPVSYWDPDQNAAIGAVIEMVTLIVASTVLFIRFRSRRLLHAILGLACALQAVMVFGQMSRSGTYSAATGISAADSAV